MHGFMSSGAQRVAKGNQTPMGMMSSGAVKQFKKERPEILKEEVEVSNKKIVEAPIVSNLYADMHVKTLKKLALENGYTGEKFDKGSLVDFLNSLLCSTVETTKLQSESMPEKV